MKIEQKNIGWRNETEFLNVSFGVRVDFQTKSYGISITAGPNEKEQQIRIFLSKYDMADIIALQKRVDDLNGDISLSDLRT